MGITFAWDYKPTCFGKEVRQDGKREIRELLMQLFFMKREISSDSGREIIILSAYILAWIKFTSCASSTQSVTLKWALLSQDFFDWWREKGKELGCKHSNLTVVWLAGSVLKSISRPDTSRRQRRQLPPLPLVIALVPLKCSSGNLQFPHRVPFSREKLPWCPCPFKNEAYSPAYIFQSWHPKLRS